MKIIKFFKTLLISGLIWIFIYTPIICIFLVVVCHTTPHRYVGEVVEISAWDGDATISTKTESGKDTLIIVYARRHEHFQIGQIITAWTGGNLIDGAASTEPQN